MSKFTKFILVALAFVFSTPAWAAYSPVSVAIVPPLQFPPSDFSVTGARVSALWGKHRDLYGIDVGVLGNITEQDFSGIAVSGLFNITHGTTNAFLTQTAGVLNLNTNKTSVYGLQFAVGMNINTAASKVVGIQASALGNIAAFTDIYGVQLGLYNRALSVTGFQIGLVNVADNLRGIQIGLVNFNHKGLFAVSPIINVGW